MTIVYILDSKRTSCELISWNIAIFPVVSEIIFRGRLWLSIYGTFLAIQVHDQCLLLQVTYSVSLYLIIGDIAWERKLSNHFYLFDFFHQYVVQLLRRATNLYDVTMTLEIVYKYVQVFQCNIF